MYARSPHHCVIPYRGSEESLSLYSLIPIGLESQKSSGHPWLAVRAPPPSRRPAHGVLSSTKPSERLPPWADQGDGPTSSPPTGRPAPRPPLS